MVWHIQIPNALPQTYSIWWDGTTTERKMNWPSAKLMENANNEIAGKNMCRNGRYFVVLIVKDSQKEHKYMKPIILIK